MNRFISGQSVTRNNVTLRSTKVDRFKGLLTVSCISIRSSLIFGRSRFDFQQRRNNFSSILCVQTGSGAHPASCTMGTGGPLLGAKARPRRDADQSPHLMLRSRMSTGYASSSLKRLVGCSGTALASYYYVCGRRK
jgi:hypothetical protein